jgi:predicted 3-demethylubiquinone-9 3-methyltransferase (glyoxalase superfamily)
MLRKAAAREGIASTLKSDTDDNDSQHETNPCMLSPHRMLHACRPGLVELRRQRSSPSGNTHYMSWRHTVSNRFQRITPFLWFHDNAEEAAHFYMSVFEHSRLLTSTRYGKEAAQACGRPEGSLMTIAFELDGQSFTAINGGPVFTFTPAVSLVVNCHSQEEVDHYWNHLSKDGDPAAQQCGWLKDRYGLSWQIVPTQLMDYITGPDQARAQKAMHAMMKMKKIDLAELRKAAA